MAKQPQAAAPTPTKPNGQGPSLNVLIQYLKDLSFENPGAPNSLRSQNKASGVNVNVDVNVTQVSEKEFDVALALNAKATVEKDVMFNIELVYGGVFRIDGFPKEHLPLVLYIECPRLLLPFARQIVAESTRNGGFQPLLIDQIDFTAMFQQRMAAEQAKGGAPAVSQ